MAINLVTRLTLGKFIITSSFSFSFLQVSGVGKSPAWLVPQIDFLSFFFSGKSDNILEMNSANRLNA
jgi:hypothetical protein